MEVYKRFVLICLKMLTIFMNTKNRKMRELNKFALNLSQRLDLRCSNKYVTLQNLSIYYFWKPIRQQYKNNKLKVISPKWNDDFELQDGLYSVSDIQDYFEYIIKSTKHYPLILLFIFTSTGLID